MKNFHVVNYHITNRCNHHCTYCFGKFNGHKDPTLDDAKKSLTILPCILHKAILLAEG